MKEPNDQAELWQAVEKRLAGVESFLPTSPPRWETADSHGRLAVRRLRPVGEGPAAASRHGDARIALLLAAVVLLVVLMAALAAGIGGRRTTSPRPATNGLLAFDLGGDIVVENADGSGRRSLTTGAAIDSDVSWSPDGAWLAFLRTAVDAPTCGVTTCSDLMVVHPDGSGLQLVAANLAPLGAESPFGPAWLLRPAWSPDDSTIAVSVRGPGPLYVQTVVLAAVDGSGSRPFEPLGNYAAKALAWSPRGTRVAFLGRDDSQGLGNAFDLYVADSDGSNVVNLSGATAPLGVLGVDPQWSPDGDRILALVGQASMLPSGEIVSFAMDETSTVLVDASRGAQAPALSRDGRQLAYLAQQPNGVPVGVSDVPPVMVLNVASGIGRVVRSGGLQGYPPVWAPDGTALIALAGVDTQDVPAKLLILDPAGVQPEREIAAAPDAGDSVGMAWRNFTISWQPALP